MQSEMFVAVLAFLGTLAGTLGGILASNKLTNHRLMELEKRVEKHDNLLERVAVLERDLQTAFRRIDKIREGK